MAVMPVFPAPLHQVYYSSFKAIYTLRLTACRRGRQSLTLASLALRHCQRWRWRLKVQRSVRGKKPFGMGKAQLGCIFASNLWMLTDERLQD